MIVLRFSVRADCGLNNQADQGRYHCGFLLVVECVPDCRVAVGPRRFEQAQLLHSSIPPHQTADPLDPWLRVGEERQQSYGCGATG